MLLVFSLEQNLVSYLDYLTEIILMPTKYLIPELLFCHNYKNSSVAIMISLCLVGTLR